MTLKYQNEKDRLLRFTEKLGIYTPDMVYWSIQRIREHILEVVPSEED